MSQKIKIMIGSDMYKKRKIKKSEHSCGRG